MVISGDFLKKKFFFFGRYYLYIQILYSTQQIWKGGGGFELLVDFEMYI